jgi:uncharacterized protein (DUF952 family)
MSFQSMNGDDRSNRLPSGTTFHLLPEVVWSQHQGRDEYLPESYEQDGFVHCTNGEEHLLTTGNRYYRDDPRPYLLLEIDLGRLDAPVLFGDDERRYPHVHGPIVRDAVKSVRRLQRDEEGTFLAIGNCVE